MAENTNFVKDPRSMRSIEHTALADINAGEIALQQDTYGMAYITVVSGTAVSLIYACNAAEVPKATGAGTAFVVGDNLYLNTSTLVVSPTKATNDLWVGVCVSAAATTATHVLADWDGRVRV
jgi:predicted RecA/RadA family phage recombinase